MNQYATMIRNLKSPEVMERLMHLYGRRDGMLVEQTGRYIGLLKRHEELFHENREVLMISAPGRTEIGGNHTDHNRGRVLAAAINLDTLSAVSARDDMMVEIHSDGYPAIKVDLGSLDVVEKEKGKTHALVRGVAARMAELGYKIGGFNAAVTSNVMSGSGLSSSAAFEVMTCAIFDALYNGFTIDYKTRAKISQYAENVYFGKPSGLLDQMASSAGGLVTVLLAVVILYLAGVDQWICIPFVTVSGGLLAWAVFRLNARYGEHGLMKLLAEKRHPRYLIHRKRVFRLFAKRKKRQS